jgi:hypothetical protein
VAQAAASTGHWVVEIVKRTELHKFVVLPKPNFLLVAAIRH